MQAVEDFFRNAREARMYDGDADAALYEHLYALVLAHADARDALRAELADAKGQLYGLTLAVEDLQRQLQPRPLLLPRLLAARDPCGRAGHRQPSWSQPTRSARGAAPPT